ncbi:hypothetical protein POM88_047555 [Heracleum sosnowskyi]|uniref:Piwi domain-containing protein n=1 Tax=Heracleum sosnowskyi TaxID=360622 RepID=A0AAD8GU59_9APIA|nr:hypothetical protein POM88_047555 [Heracleum sosnowskyi]
MIESEDARLFPTVCGYLTTICKLITQEVGNIESLQRSLHIDISQGFILYKLVELLGIFLDVPNIRSRFTREQLLSEILEALLHASIGFKSTGRKKSDPFACNLKRICEMELGIMSQCCLTKHVFKMCKQYMPKVALKINVKDGGGNTVLCHAVSRQIPVVSDRPTIIFGADVTHPHLGEDYSSSLAAVVASQDWPEMTKYAGLVCAQAHRQELTQDLYKSWQDPNRGGTEVHGGMTKEPLVSFRRSSGKKLLLCWYFHYPL